MNLTVNYMTRNDCYTIGRKIISSGIMVHSTATPGVMAADWFSRWNKSYDKGEIARQVCVHAFVDDKEVCQYLPWNHRGWHAGGVANNTHIGFEICEPPGFAYAKNGYTMVGYDVAKQEAYFRAAWDNAVELCAMLCKMYGLNETHIICHSEGYRKGVASKSADVMHWFPKHGESMDTFRAAVRAALAQTGADTAPATTVAHVPMLFAEVNRVEVQYGVYGAASGRDHRGIDVDTLAGMDQTVYSTVQGYVEFAGSILKGNDLTWEWGDHVRIFEGQTNATRKKGTRRHTFAHCKEGMLVKAEQTVSVGQALGTMGKSGNAASDRQAEHVHYQVDEWNGSKWEPMDPTPFCGIQNIVGQWTNTGGTPAPAPAPGELGVGAMVEIRPGSTRYYPGSKAIPGWVISDYYHIVTQTTIGGSAVQKGKKTCVLLGKRRKKSGGSEEAGINTWANIDILNVVGSSGATDVATYTVKKGDSLWAIAAAQLGNGARYKEVQALNGLTSELIHPGQVLKLPAK